MSGIFKGMFKPSYGYFRGAVAIILGLALIIWPNNTPETIMMAMGVVLALLGAISIISSLVKRKKDKSANVDVPIINGIIVTVIGVIVAVWPGDFLKYAFILLGILLAVQAINMIVMLVRARKYSPVGWPFLHIPDSHPCCRMYHPFLPDQDPERSFHHIRNIASHIRSG
jgi:uncharacterized membrane protein HdeD (DUF308 family)